MNCPAIGPISDARGARPVRMNAPIRLSRSRGFTLIEVIIVIVITGVIAAVVAIFIPKPVQGYFDSVRRAQLTDSADLALRRIARDIQTALPNSIRSGDANNYFLEFLPVRSGGRYRSSPDSGDPLDLTSPSLDTSFDVLGPVVSVAAGDSIVIYNTGQSGANAYDCDNRRPEAASGAALATIVFSVAAAAPCTGQFPRDSPSRIFQVVSTPVTYACDAANGVLWRFSGYLIQSGQPATIGSAPLVSGARLANNVVCQSSGTDLGTGFVVRNADGLVGLRIHLRDANGEEVRLYREVHVDNTP